MALQALSRALTDPAPRLLHGAKGKPVFFEGTGQPARQAALLCLDQGWLEPTGASEGKGKSAKPLYRITPAGRREVLENSEELLLLRDAAQALGTIQTRLDQAAGSLAGLKEVFDKLNDRLRPPDLESLRPTGPPDVSGRLLAAVADYQKNNPFGHCPLPDLFRQAAEPAGLTIGQFHDALRRLVQQGQIRLHPFTGAAYQLRDEQYALVAGQEIKYYAERLAGS